jgi:hypothetical protein
VRFGKTLERHLSLIKNQLQNFQGESVVANRPLLVVHLVESVPKAQQHIFHCLRKDNLLYVLRMRMIPVQQSGVVDIKIYQLLR